MDAAVRTRRASLADIDALVPLFDAYRQFYGQQPDRLLAYKFLVARLSAGESTIFLAEGEDGAALGFAQLYPSFSSGLARRIFILNDLFVQPGARRRGIGRQLIDSSAEFAARAGAARLSLATAADNRTAQSLYEAVGWKRDDAFVVYNLALEE